ncbi:MAG TPA: sulfotransferase, partial [Candidatus Limnocylindrales bacterium]
MTPGGPIFVGGTGRSGTTVVGQLVGAHAGVFRVVPTEVRFLTDRSGLLDLLASARTPATRRSLVRRLIVRRRRRRKDVVTPREFLTRLREHWYGWTGPDGDRRGLRTGGMERETLEGLLEGFEERFADDPLAASRRLARELIGELAHDAPRWVETTPGNVARVRDLDELFQGLRLVHVVRDGRDTAASISMVFWGPNDLFAALDWWADRMTRAYTALEGFDPQRALTIRLE